MSRSLNIAVEWQPLSGGSREEESCFAGICIAANGVALTEAQDRVSNQLRKAPRLSAYHLAEWFAWNWWRLRWEPRSSSDEWQFAHKMSNIGGGYIWPNLTIFSDGERSALIARPSQPSESSAFRYISDLAQVVSSVDYEAAVDEFIELVLRRLESHKIEGSNLACVWSDVIAERADPLISRYRKLEALMGKQPDQLSTEVLNSLIDDAETLGLAAVEEIAAEYGHEQNKDLVSANELKAQARSFGFATDMSDRPSPLNSECNVQRGVPAWVMGAEFAKTLRDTVRLGDQPIKDKSLAEMLGVSSNAITGRKHTKLGMSYVIKKSESQGSVVLRSRWKNGRRFELARLLGDTLMYQGQENLSPATRSYTYRQKAQRSFAAELLSPYQAVINQLQGDYSPESQQEVANYFDVSEITIRTQLVNHGILDREELDSERIATAA